MRKVTGAMPLTVLRPDARAVPCARGPAISRQTTATCWTLAVCVADAAGRTRRRIVLVAVDPVEPVDPSRSSPRWRSPHRTGECSGYRNTANAVFIGLMLGSSPLREG